MPRVSYFFGILIRMFHNDHLPPHFHAEYGDDESQGASTWRGVKRWRGETEPVRSSA